MSSLRLPETAPTPDAEPLADAAPTVVPVISRILATRAAAVAWPEAVPAATRALSRPGRRALPRGNAGKINATAAPEQRLAE